MRHISEFALALAAVGLAGCAPKESKQAQGESAAPREYVYVSNEDSRNITVIDAATDSVVATIEVGTRPRGIKVSPDGKTVYVALSGSPK